MPSKEKQPSIPPSIGSMIDRLAPLLAFLLLLGLWEGACRGFHIQSFLLPAPSAIIGAAVAIAPGVWIQHIIATLHVALMGYLLAIAISLPLAMILASHRLISRTLLPLLIIIQSTPIVAIAPVIVVTLGSSDLSRIAITFMISFFPIVVATITGVTVTPPELIELSRSLRAGTVREMLQIRLPYAVPFIFSALKVSTALCVIGAVVAEFVSAEHGLGYLILLSTSSFKIPTAFAALTVLVVCSLILFYSVSALQRRLFGWSVSVESH